ncbi:glycerol-3-phosphate dehydrogenase C-terminal domain-containing protein, partial [Agromyces mediolanus]|uniref:glycerol-3-phosphate dehydrogenase C-terminal domain-containing protein n=1 Tax=Agromyces mediolanus TaxID=41986 RepID=UPI0027E1F1B6
AEDLVLANHSGYSRQEIAWLVRHERVARLDDLVLRRTSIAFTGTATLPLLEELAAIAGEVLGWNGERQRAEVQATRALLAERHGVQLPALEVSGAQ